MSNLAKIIMCLTGGHNFHISTFKLERAPEGCHAALTAFAPLAMTVSMGTRPGGVGA